jgi:hypothetical protein
MAHYYSQKKPPVGVFIAPEFYTRCLETNPSCGEQETKQAVGPKLHAKAVGNAL